MSTSDDFEHIEKFSCEYKRYEAIDELLSEYGCDFKDWNDKKWIRFDIYFWTLKLLRANSCVRPIAVYVALLENGYKANDESRSILEECIRTLVKLKYQGLLTWELEDDGVVTEYTIFTPMKGEHFNDFSSRIFEISMNHMISSYGDTRIAVEDIE